MEGNFSEPTVTKGQAIEEASEASSPETSEKQVGFDFQKLENQLVFNRAIEQGKELVIEDGKNGKTKGFFQECGGRKRKSSQKSGDPTAEGVRSDTGSDRETVADPSDRKGQGAGGNNSPTYVKEWVEDSGVHPDIVRLNVRYLEGQQALDYLLYSDNIERTNTGRVSLGTLKSYQHVEAGGWWCSGIDILTGEDSLWGCYKPDNPRIDFKRGKAIKYEHPKSEPTSIFALRVTEEISAKIYEKLGLDSLDDVPPSKEEDKFYWDTVKNDETIPVIGTEGVKKAGGLLSAGYTAIAVPGVWNGFRKQPDGTRVLIPEVEALAIPGRTFYLAFDQDEKRSTQRDVRTALGIFAKLLKEKGCKVKVIEWEPTFKGVDDLIVAKGEKHFDECYRKALDFDDWEADRLSLLTYKPALKLDSTTKYIDPFEIPAFAKLVGIKAPKGSGKTEVIVNLCASAQYRGQKVLVLTHRTQLGKELAKRFGIDYVSEVSSSETKGVFGYVLCFDSLKKKSQARFDPEEWHGCIVILDECEQSIWHLLSSTTEVAKCRIEILRNFQQVIINALRDPEGKVILSDADLSDLSINYIKSLSGLPIEPWIVLKEGNPHPWDVTIWETPEELMARLEVEIRDGGKVWISVDGQKAKSKWGTRNLEAYFTKRFFGKRILRIDRETVEMPGHPAFECMDKLNEIVGDYDIVIASPTVETGVSINILGHFTGVYDFAQGVVPVSSVLQRMARVRAVVPRHIWAKKSSYIGRFGNGSASIRRLKESLDTNYQANVLALVKSDLPDDLDFDQAAQFQPQSLWTWLKMAARINLGMMRYRHEIIRGLIRDGHNVKMGDPQDLDDMGAPASQDVKDGLCGTRDRIYWEYNDKTANTPNPNDEEFKELKEKRQRTEAELIKYRKGRLSRSYSPELASKPELLEADDKGNYKKWRLLYYTTVGAEFLSERDRNIINTQFSEDGAFFLPDINSKLLGGKILVLNRLGIPRLLDPEAELSNKSQFLQELKENALKYKEKIKDSLQVTLHEKDTPITIAQKILRQSFDHPLKFSKKIGSRGQQDRIYQAQELSPLKKECFEVWLERDKAEREKRLAATSSENNLGSHTGNINTIIPSVTTGEAVATENFGSHTGNINTIIPSVATDEVATENFGSHAGNINTIYPSVATSSVDTTPTRRGKRLFIIPSGVSEKVAGVAAAATIAGGLPAAANQMVEAAPNSQPIEMFQPPVQEHHWDEMPKPGRVLYWVTGGHQALVLKAIDPDGYCQVKSLVSGLVTHTSIGKLRPTPK